MASRKEFLREMWMNVINGQMSGRWIENVLASCERDRQGPFADTGVALKRVLESGADRRDLSLLARYIGYETVFRVLYMLDDPGVDGDDFKMMHEELLGSDPSGMDGRPGSAP